MHILPNPQSNTQIQVVRISFPVMKAGGHRAGAIYAIHSLLQFTIKLTEMKGQPSVFQAGEWGPITITRWWSSACKISIFLVRAKLLQSCLTVWDSMGHTPQAPLSPMRFFCKDYWSLLPCPPPGNLPNPGLEPASLMSPALVGRFFTSSAIWQTYIFFKISRESLTTFRWIT